MSPNLFNIFYLFAILFQIIYEVHTISFEIFFVWAFKFVVVTRKFSMLLLYIFL